MANLPTVRKMYHVSPQFNLISILEKGVDPERSTGKQKLAWYVDPLRLSWAIAHVSDKLDISVHGLMVFTVFAGREYFTRTRLTGVYTAKTALFVWSYDSAITLLKPDLPPS